MKLVPADTLGTAELADLFTRGYEGYFVPIHIDEAGLRSVVDAWDLDLSRSRVALDPEPVGVAMLALRGERGWIGGLGVVASARRRGIGRALMDALLVDAPRVVTLEVIEANEPAINLYEALGFERRRILEVWSLKAAVARAESRTVPPQPLGQEDLPWQRADASLPATYERIEVDGGAALISVSGAHVNVLQLEARDADAAATLLAAARARGGSLAYVNVPEGDVASAALAGLGGRLDLRQFEYVRNCA